MSLVSVEGKPSGTISASPGCPVSVIAVPGSGGNCVTHALDQSGHLAAPLLPSARRAPVSVAPAADAGPVSLQVGGHFDWRFRMELSQPRIPQCISPDLQTARLELSRVPKLASSAGSSHTCRTAPLFPLILPYKGQSLDVRPESGPLVLKCRSPPLCRD